MSDKLIIGSLYQMESPDDQNAINELQQRIEVLFADVQAQIDALSARITALGG